MSKDMLDDFDLDLDDINFDDIDFSRTDSDNSGPVFKVGKAILNETADNLISGSRVSDQLDRLLPAGLLAVKRDTSKVYDEFTRDLGDIGNDFKRSSKSILLDISGMVPKGVLSNYLKKRSDSISVEKKHYSYDTSEEDEAARQQDILGEVFAEVQTKVFGENQLRSEVLSGTQHQQTVAISKTAIQIADEIRKEVTTASRFNEYINVPYQKKSLELRLKSLYVSKKHYELSKLSAEKTVSFLEGILHNTAVPDFRKTGYMDAGMLGHREKMVDAVLNSGTLKESAVGRAAARLATRGKSGLMRALGGVQGLETASSLGGSMGGTGAGYEMTGGAIAGFGLDFAYDRAGRAASGLFGRGKVLNKRYLGVKKNAASMRDNLHERAKQGEDYLSAARHTSIFGNMDDGAIGAGGKINYRDYEGKVKVFYTDEGRVDEVKTQTNFEEEMIKAGKFSKNAKQKGFGSRLYDRVTGTAKAKSNIFLSELLKEDEYSEPTLVEGAGDLYKSVSFDTRTHTTINKVIPGLLSRINSSVREAGGLSEGEVKWDYIKGEFTTSSDMLTRTQDRVKADLGLDYLDDSVQRAVRDISLGAGLTKEEERIIQEKLTTGVAEDQFGIRSIRDFDSLTSDKYRDKFDDVSEDDYNTLMTKLRNKQDSISVNDSDDISKSIRDISDSYQDPTASLSFLANRERYDELEKMGVLKRDAAGSMRLDKEGYLNFLKGSAQSKEMDIDTSGELDDFYAPKDNSEDIIDKVFNHSKQKVEDTAIQGVTNAVTSMEGAYDQTLEKSDTANEILNKIEGHLKPDEYSYGDSNHDGLRDSSWEAKAKRKREEALARLSAGDGNNSDNISKEETVEEGGLFGKMAKAFSMFKLGSFLFNAIAPMLGMSALTLASINAIPGNFAKSLKGMGKTILSGASKMFGFSKLADFFSRKDKGGAKGKKGFFRKVGGAAIRILKKSRLGKIAAIGGATYALLGMGGADADDMDDANFASSGADRAMTDDIKQQENERELAGEPPGESSGYGVGDAFNGLLVAETVDRYLLGNKGKNLVKDKLNPLKNRVSKIPTLVPAGVTEKTAPAKKAGGKALKVVGKAGKWAMIMSAMSELTSMAMGSETEEEEEVDPNAPTEKKSFADKAFSMAGSGFGLLTNTLLAKEGMKMADNFFLNGMGQKAAGYVGDKVKDSKFLKKAKTYGGKALRFAKRYKGAARVVLSTFRATPKNPWALGIAAVGLIGYGSYRLYKGDTTPYEAGYLTLLRFAQYGAFPVVRKDQLDMDETYTKLYMLENDIIERGKISIKDNGDVNMDYDPTGILTIFDVSDKDKGRFLNWLQNRFLPVLTTHLSIYDQMGYLDMFYSMDQSGNIGMVPEVEAMNVVRRRLFTKLMEIPVPFESSTPPPNMGMEKLGLVSTPNVYAPILDLIGKGNDEPYANTSLTATRTKILSHVSGSKTSASAESLGKDMSTIDKLVDTNIETYNKQGVEIEKQIKKAGKSKMAVLASAAKRMDGKRGTVSGAGGKIKKAAKSFGVLKTMMTSVLTAFGVNSDDMNAMRGGYDKPSGSTAHMPPPGNVYRAETPIDFDEREKLIASGYLNHEGLDPYFFTEAEETQEKMDKIKTLCVQVAKSVGLDPKAFLSFIAVESGFRPYRRPYSRRLGKYLSSAKGIAQILDGTWRDWVKKWGKEYGILLSLSSLNVKASLILSARNAKDNKVGNDGVISYYLPHLLGAGGARAYFRNLNRDPHANTLKYLTSKVVFANRGFFAGKSMLESYNTIKKHLASLATAEDVGNVDIDTIASAMSRDVESEKIVKEFAPETKSFDLKMPLALQGNNSATKPHAKISVPSNNQNTNIKSADAYKNTDMTTPPKVKKSSDMMDDGVMFKEMRKNTDMYLKASQNKAPINITVIGVPDAKVEVEDKDIKNPRKVMTNDVAIPSNRTGFDNRAKGE